MNLVTIGLEIHISLKVDRKAFAPEKITEASWISLGLPGTLPCVNMDAIYKTIQTAYLLNCQVNFENISFDRKNYFYHDLPKGYQITQYFYPMGKDGYVNLSNGKKIFIQQVHLEEDTAQQFKEEGKIKFNFSRLGKALVEIVTGPNFSTYEEIEEFLRYLRRLCLFNNLSSVAYEHGDIRVDLNISVRKNSSDSLNVKSEIKNLNSLKSIKKSIEYLVALKIKNLNENKQETSLTYMWSEASQSCEIMRRKKSFCEYFYIPEANIPPFAISKEKYLSLTSNLIKDFSSLKAEWKSKGLRDAEINFLLDNHTIFSWVFRLNDKLNDLIDSYNWIANILSGISENFNWSDDFYFEIEKTILETVQTKKINLNFAKKIFKEIIVNNLSFSEAYKKLDVHIIVDLNKIRQWVDLSFEKYKDQMPKLSSNIMKLEKLIIGEVMKQSKGQADPVMVKKIFDEALKSWI